MDSSWIALIGVLGACFGSFAQLVIDRLPQQVIQQSSTTLLFPCSQCACCQRRLRIRDLIPIISYLLRRGRCGYCLGPIGLSALVMELLYGLLAITIVCHRGITPIAAAQLCFIGFMIPLSVIDARHLILPDELTLTLLWLGLIINTQATVIALPQAVSGAVLGYSLCWALHHGYRLLRHKNGLGLGDAKCCAAIGAWFGGYQLLLIITVASLCALGWVGYHCFKQSIHTDQQIPFGPFLALASTLFMCCYS